MMSVQALMVSHVQKNYVAAHFDNLDLRNLTVLHMMPWAPCNAGAKGIT